MSTYGIDGVSTSFVHEKKGSRELMVTYGRLYDNVLEANAILEKNGKACDTLKIVKVFPLSDKIIDIIRSYDRVCFFEESYKDGSLGEKYAAICGNVETHNISGFVSHGEPDALLDELGLSAQKIAMTMAGESSNET